jgi:hypothetical protein
VIARDHKLIGAVAAGDVEQAIAREAETRVLRQRSRAKLPCSHDYYSMAISVEARAAYAPPGRSVSAPRRLDEPGAFVERLRRTGGDLVTSDALI